MPRADESPAELVQEPAERLQNPPAETSAEPEPAALDEPGPAAPEHPDSAAPDQPASDSWLEGDWDEPEPQSEPESEPEPEPQPEPEPEPELEPRYVSEPEPTDQREPRPGLPPHAAAPTAPPGFRQRARIRRRSRYLRSLREIQLRDLGGFLLELHRRGVERPDLVAMKLRAAADVDTELRTLERALASDEPLREIRETGIGGACEACGAVHGSADRFCATCGEPLRGEPLRGEALPDERGASGLR